MTELITSIIRSQVKSSEPFPVDFDIVWTWLEYSSKGVAKNALEQCKFEEKIDYDSFVQITNESQKKIKRKRGGQEQKIYLTIDCMKQFCMMSNSAKGREVRQYYLTIEKEYRKLLEEMKTPRLPVSGEWLATRETGKEILKGLNDAVKEHTGSEARHFMLVRDGLYRGLFGMDSKKLREIMGLVKKDCVRDWFDDHTLSLIQSGEYSINVLIEQLDIQGGSAIYQTALQVGQSLRRFLIKPNGDLELPSANNEQKALPYIDIESA